MIKQLYRRTLALLTALPGAMHISKMYISEWWAIWRKRKMYETVEFSKAARQEFEVFWRTNYGKTVSDRWHRQYASINSTLVKDYVPDVVFAARIEPLLNPFRYASLYSDKSLAELLYASVKGVYFPETIAVGAGDYFYGKNRAVISEIECLEALSAEPEFVIKPLVGGSSGRGVTFVRSSVESFEERIPEIRRLLISFRLEGFIAQRVLKPHPAYAKIYAGSINTIRLITFVASGSVRVAPICLRIGQGGAEVDNIHAGGLVVGVTDAGALLGNAYELGYSDSKKVYRNHPDSNFEFEGYHLPGIKEMASKAIQMHGCTPHLGIVSWDLMLDAGGRVVLVEANYIGQSIWFPQIAHGSSIFGPWTTNVLETVRDSHGRHGSLESSE